MFGPNTVVLVAIGVALAGTRSSNFIFRGLSTTVIAVLLVVVMLAATGRYIANEIMAPSALQGMIPPAPVVDRRADAAMGSSRIYDLDR